MIDRRIVLATAIGVVVGAGGRARAETAPQTVRLRHPDGRETEYRVLLPAKPGRLGLLVFSHGAYAANDAYDLMLQPWANAGFLCVAPNHIDARTKSPMAPHAMASREGDMTLPLDQRHVFEAIAAKAGSRLGPQNAAAGHSAGGGVIKTMMGAKLSDGSSRVDPRFSCIVAFSPPGPEQTHLPLDSWSGIHVPAFLQTGTADVIPPYVTHWQDHMQGFENDLGRDRWLAIGTDVDHLFGGLICYLAAGPKAEAQRQALAVTVGLSAEFLRAYAKGDGAAKARLKSAAARQTHAPAVVFSGF